MKIHPAIHIPAESATVAINSLAQQKAAAGEVIFNLSAGEPKLLPHPIILEAVSSALRSGKTLYPPVAGLPQLRQEAARWLNEGYGSNYASEQCLVTNGGKFGLYLLLQLLVHAGDEIIIPSPYWVSYPAMVQLFGGVARCVSTAHSDWKLTADDLRQACTSKSRILFLNNAANPTGVLYSEDELRALLQVAAERQLWVISDEVYSGLLYDQAEFVSCGRFIEHQDRVIIIQSCSKNFAMTGWRVGFVFANTDIIRPLTILIGQSTSGANTIGQWVAYAVLQQAQVVTDYIRTELELRRDILLSALQDHTHCRAIAPRSALYFFIKLQQLGWKESDSVAFCQQALSEANVAVVPGIAFGQEGYVRLSFGAVPEELLCGVQSLARMIAQNTI